MAKKWMAKAFGKHPGLLHRKLGVPQDQTIPASTLSSAYAGAKRSGDTTLMREINAARRGGEVSRRHSRRGRRWGRNRRPARKES